VVVGLCEGKMKLFLEGKNSFVCVESWAKTTRSFFHFFIS
jgi:hypothetical protein